MTNIAVIVGSLRKESLNNKFAQVLEARMPEGVSVTHIVPHLPLYDGDIEDAGIPADVQAAKDAILAADGVVLITPEYNRSISGVLKNAIDWISRPYGMNSFAGKPVALAGVSPSPLGTTQAQFQLRSIAAFLGMHVMGQPEMYVDATRFFNENGEVSKDAEAMLDSYVSALVRHIEQFNTKG